MDELKREVLDLLEFCYGEWPLITQLACATVLILVGFVVCIFIQRVRLKAIKTSVAEIEMKHKKEEEKAAAAY